MALALSISRTFQGLQEEDENSHVCHEHLVVRNRVAYIFALLKETEALREYDFSDNIKRGVRDIFVKANGLLICRIRIEPGKERRYSAFDLDLLSEEVG